jgi:glycerol-3-phosphate cytidylyltransferase
MEKMRTIITFGTYDLLHVGHIRLLSRARELGDRLVVGVSSDQLNFSKKNKYPEFSQQERMEIISMIKGVDQVFLEESLELKASYLKEYEADVLVMGDDWSGKFDHLSTICKVAYLPRTPSISTTAIIEKTRS